MIGAAIRKDFALVLADRGGLLALFAMPIIFMAVFAAVFAGDDGGGRRFELVVHVATENGETIVAGLKETGVFEVEVVDSAAAVRERVARRDAVAGLIVPADFAPLSNRPAELSIDEVASAQLVGPIAGAAQAVLAQTSFSVAPTALLRPRSPEQLRPSSVAAVGAQVAVPGNAVLFGFFLALTIAISFLDERKSETLRRLCAAPVPRWKILWAKLVPYTLVGVVQMAFFFAFGALFLGLRVGGSLFALTCLSASMVICATSLGLFIASFSGTQKQVGGVGSIVLLIMGLVGGAMFPRVAMGDVMQSAGLFTPHAWALDGYYELLLRDGAGIADVATEIAALMAFSAVFAVVGALRFRFDS